MASFGSLIFHYFISILVMAPIGQRKTTLSLELAYIFSIHVQVCTTERLSNQINDTVLSTA